MATRLFFCQQAIKKLITLKQPESVFDKGHHFDDITFINSMTKLKKNRGEKYTVYIIYMYYTNFKQFVVKTMLCVRVY